LTVFSSRSGLLRALAAIILAASASACASLGRYVWVDEYRDPNPPPKVSPGAYILAADDVIEVRVFGQEGMSAKARIRSDGKISLPFLNDVLAAGYEPPALAQQLQTRLKDFINQPVVTVSLEESRKMQIAVVGEVPHQGMVTLPPSAGVLEALANAGGLGEFAGSDRIFVLRPEPQPVRIRFSYPALLRARGQGPAFHLRPGDVIVVE
jgi:polysaccharide export outer membrane protein